MSCQVVNSQSQVQSRLPSLPQTLPKTQADWNAVLATFNQWGSILQQASHAPNVIPSQFQTFTVSAATAVIAALSASNCTPSIDSGTQYYGAASLKVAISATGATLAFSGFPISIAPASRWFASFQIYAPSGCTGSITVKTSTGHSATESFTVSALAEWQQVWGLVDLRQYADTQATWQFTFTSTATVWLDGMQMNAVGSPIGTLPKFAGTQMVTGALAYQSNLDGVPDGSTYRRMPTANMDSNRRGLIDFTQAGHVSKNLDNVADGSTYGRVIGAGLSAGKLLAAGMNNGAVSAAAHYSAGDNDLAPSASNVTIITQNFTGAYTTLIDVSVQVNSSPSIDALFVNIDLKIDGVVYDNFTVKLYGSGADGFQLTGHLQAYFSDAAEGTHTVTVVATNNDTNYHMHVSIPYMVVLRLLN